jgi:hypothetical protein
MLAGMTFLFLVLAGCWVGLNSAEVKIRQLEGRIVMAEKQRESMLIDMRGLEAELQNLKLQNAEHRGLLVRSIVLSKGHSGTLIVGN